MDNFKIIYRILKRLEGLMDVDEPDFSCLDAEHLGISPARWRALMTMLIDEGYISGVRIVRTKTMDEVLLLHPQITLAGLTYLEENSLMQKAYRLAKGIKDVTPGF